MMKESSASASRDQSGRLDVTACTTLREVRSKVPTLPTATPATRPRIGPREVEPNLGAISLPKSYHISEVINRMRRMQDLVFERTGW